VGAAAAATTTATAPRADANAGTPNSNATAGLNAQVRQTPPEQAPGGAATQVAAAAAPPPLYTQACVVCHAAGVANAPKLGDKAAWAPRLPQGLDGLTASVIKGKGAMPPKGGSNASEADIRATVSYMVSTVK
jgi:cytochrome c5